MVTMTTNNYVQPNTFICDHCLMSWTSHFLATKCPQCSERWDDSSYYLPAKGGGIIGDKEAKALNKQR